MNQPIGGRPRPARQPEAAAPPPRPIGEETAAAGSRPIGAEAVPAGGRPIVPGGGALVPQGLPVRSETGPPAPGRPVEAVPEFGLPGASIEAPFSYFAGAPVLGPGSLFNIGGAPIAILGGVFGGGLPIGGPVTQIFRSGAPIPNTLYIITLSPGGPIGQFFLPAGGGPVGMGPAGGIGPVGTVGLPIGLGFGEAGTPIFGTAPVPGVGIPITESGGLPL